MPYKTIPVYEDLFNRLQRIKKKVEENIGCKISWDVFIENLLIDNRDPDTTNAIADLIVKIVKRR